jgi:hypothetical protein
MTRYIKLFQILLFISSKVCFCQGAYKVIHLYNNLVSLNVPSTWKIKGKSSPFGNYKIKYNVAYKDKTNNSGVDLYVFDSLYGPKMQITDSTIEAKKISMSSDTVRKIICEESGIKIVSGIKVGYIKYTFASLKSERSYGVDFFFRNRQNIFFNLVIRGINKNVREFKTTANKVFQSFKLNAIGYP